MTTRAPSRAKPREIAFPMPVSPPVTMATLSAKCMQVFERRFAAFDHREPCDAARKYHFQRPVECDACLAIPTGEAAQIVRAPEKPRGDSGEHTPAGEFRDRLTIAKRSHLSELAISKIASRFSLSDARRLCATS